jgi:hypothetical protein
MRDRAWWKRWEGMPWENYPDADERTRFLDRSLTMQVAKLVVAPVVLTLGVAASLAARQAWLAAFIWTTIGMVLVYGCYHLWRKLRNSRR